MSHVRSNSNDDTRQHIISSLFSKRGPDGSPEETLITYVKVFEEDEGSGSKTRYLMLAVTKLGKVVIHKAKRNSNLSFSKGKTWNLEDMRIVEVMGPSDFALTMTVRRYHWTTDRPRDQQHFLNSAVKVYQKYTNGELPELLNFELSSSTSSTDHRRQSSSSSISIPAQPPSNSSRTDLVPPPGFRQNRSGSSHSIASGTSSNYGGGGEIPPVRSRMGEGSTRSRPSIDDTRSNGFGRSPLSESSIRRPSLDHRVSPRKETNTLAPPVQARRTSDDRDARSFPGSTASNGQSPAPPPAAGLVRRPSDDPFYDDETPPPVKETPKSNRPPDLTPAPPTITTTLPSPSIPPPPTPERNRPQRRKSFHPAPVNTAFSREVLLASRTGVLPGGAGLTVDTDKETSEEALMNNVEEMLEGFDWTAGVIQNQTSIEGVDAKKGSVDAIEGRLLDELAALDQANIHAFLESDDRIAQVLGHIDEALQELDDIDMQITGYRMQLNAVTEDISFIESQNRGLQVQTSNQHALLDELRQLLQIVEVPEDALRALAQESPQTSRGLQSLESAATALYKALQAGRDTANAEVAATIARMREYQDQSSHFCKRMLEYLDVTFRYQSDTALTDSRKSGKKALAPHTAMGEFLMQYEGLVLYIKEMDEARYQKLCSNYLGTISSLHQSEIKDLLMSFMQSIKAGQSKEPRDALFSTAMSAAPKPGALARSKTAVGLGSISQSKPAKKADDNSATIAELYQLGLTQIINQVLNEEGFINAFLHLTDTESTFADHMELDSYFRRQAARHATRQLSSGMMQLIRNMMDLVFGFVDLELKNWVEAAAETNPIAIIGITVVTERLAQEAEAENTSIFFAQLFDRQIARQRAALDLLANEQVKAIDLGKNRRRKGAIIFMRQFPIFASRIEPHLHDAQSLPVRTRVNEMYERIVNAMFATLQHIAKLERAESQSADDKGQLSYNVVMIENLYHFVEDMKQLTNPALVVFLERAKGMLEDNMSTYVKMMLRRQFGKLMEFFDGVDRQLKSTPASEVSMHNAYNKSALKKALKDSGSSKDLRKSIEALSKRVDKHFADDDSAGSSHSDASTQSLIQAVWKEITAGLVTEVNRASRIIKSSYGDSGQGLEYGPGDVEAICKRSK
ncbi:exocyst complex component Sec3-domain-containing protein [Kockovaella imperatae]|uniref:Exocyst complex component Sec3-domain-containing protein n=1 Tax=Kockovaella imperatae TaxID=4999 RepID=A0A1Y1U9G7_9TREE|nr:exocyst complex component Sec3-domain-containing protein [Kockovaella imperatae]ORX34673.1 exocyst complex component Sec3-domain-containing protein [Kockovaella imperatae]